MGPVPDICGIVADGVAVESLQVVNDGHQVNEGLAGVVGQAKISQKQCQEKACQDAEDSLSSGAFHGKDF